jgi:hypothetical protein
MQMLTAEAERKLADAASKAQAAMAQLSEEHERRLKDTQAAARAEVAEQQRSAAVTLKDVTTQMQRVYACVGFASVLERASSRGRRRRKSLR